MTKIYRPCVGVMLLNRDGLAFVGRRRPKTNDPVSESFTWQMPQGGIDDGEAPHAAAVRELYEETNVQSITPLAESSQWLSYDLPPESAMRWKGKYAGQTQKWFAFRFTGTDDEIDIHNPAGGAHEVEFDDWRWERPALLPGLIVPFKRAVYEAVVVEFASIVAAG
jgi:putative (di)nucleoside polyphosphate hydrolase